MKFISLGVYLLYASMMKSHIPAHQYRGMLSPTTDFTTSEKTMASFLIIDANDERANLLKKALVTNGFITVSVISSYEQAMSQLKERSFSHVIFALQEEDRYTANRFLSQARSTEPASFYIALAAAPESEQIFQLLQLGAQGFLLDPFSALSVLDVLEQATKGEPISRTLLEAEDRNAVFSALVSKNLDIVAESKSRESGEVSPEELQKLKRAAQSAKLFSQGGEGALLQSFIHFFTQLAEGPATSLGRLRAKLKAKRMQKRE